MKTLLLHINGVHVSVVVLFLGSFATVLNKNLGLFLSSIRVDRYIDLAALRDFQKLKRLSFDAVNKTH